MGPDDEDDEDDEDDAATDEDGGGWSRPPAVPSLVPELGAAPGVVPAEFEAHEAAAAAAGAPEAFDTSAIDAMLYAKDRRGDGGENSYLRSSYGCTLPR